MKISHATTLAYLMSVTTLAHAEVGISFGAGTDDNPFRLSEQFNLDAASYIVTELNIDKDYSIGTYFDFNAQYRKFEAGAENADDQKVNVEFGYKKAFNKMHSLRVEAAYRDFDKTYISRSRGSVGTFNGQPIPDRYDYSWKRFQGEYGLKLNKTHRFVFIGEQLTKEYFDYTPQGLSNLDYQHLGLETRWIYRFDPSWTFDARYRYRIREYDDRRARDLDGNTIAGSDLEYTYGRLTTTVTWNLDKQHRLRGQVFFEDKADNFTGYYDTEYVGATISYRWKTPIDSRLNTSFRYTDYTNNNVLPENEFEEENNTNDNNGYTLSFSYYHPLKESKNARLDGYIKGSLRDFEAPQDIYQYQRSNFEMGVKMTF